VTASRALLVQPDSEFRARARYQLHSLFEKVQPKRRAPLLVWQPRWALVVVVLLAVVVVGGGTVVAADNTMPGNPLYPVKLTTERVRLTLTPSDVGKAELYTALADRRVAEIAYMANKGRTRMVELAAQRLREHLAEMNRLSLGEKAATKAADKPVRVQQGQIAKGSGPVYAPDNARARLRVVLRQKAINHPAKLRAILKLAPASAKPALSQAIAVSVASYEKALKDLD